MNWIPVQNKYSTDYFELWDNEKKLVNLSTSDFTKITRIQAKEEKALYFIEKKKFQHNKAVIKNEYGIPLGEMIANDQDENEGTVGWDGSKYVYSFSNRIDNELTIFDENRQNELIRCHLPYINERKKFRAFTDTKYAALVTALCWYLLR
jgi:hypothetical protein